MNKVMSSTQFPHNRFSALNTRNRHKKQENRKPFTRVISLSLWERAGVRVGEAIRR